MVEFPLAFEGSWETCFGLGSGSGKKCLSVLLGTAVNELWELVTWRVYYDIVISFDEVVKVIILLTGCPYMVHVAMNPC